MLRHEARGQALDGIAAGLAAPFAGGEIVLDLAGGQALEDDDAVSTRRPTQPSVRRHQRDRRHARGGAGPTAASRQARASAAVAALGRMRRPQATTVSAPSTKAPAMARAPPPRALAAASRSACCAGSSPGSGVSSISAGSTTSGAERDLRAEARGGAARRTPGRGAGRHARPDRRYLKRKVMRPLVRS